MLVDTHCHVQLDRFDNDREEVLDRAAAAGVSTLICVGYDPDSNRRAQDLIGSWSPASSIRLYATAGLHPHDAKHLKPELLTEIRELGRAGRIVAVGECGLDFYRNLSTPEQQRRAFIAQIELARELNLPLIVHDREAHDEVLGLLREHGAKRGVMHCFSGDWPFARACLDLGFYISIAGPVTYPNARDLPEVASKVPADRIVVETDCPFLSPQSYRGKRNEPARVAVVAERVAQLRGVDMQAFAALSTTNALTLFGLS